MFLKKSQNQFLRKLPEVFWNGFPDNSRKDHWSNLGKKKSGVIPEEVLGGTLNGVLLGIPEGAPVEILEAVPEGIKKDASGNNSDKFLEKSRKRFLKESWKKLPEGFPRNPGKSSWRISSSNPWKKPGKSTRRDSRKTSWRNTWRSHWRIPDRISCSNLRRYSWRNINLEKSRKESLKHIWKEFRKELLEKSQVKLLEGIC